MNGKQNQRSSEEGEGRAVLVVGKEKGEEETLYHTPGNGDDAGDVDKDTHVADVAASLW